MSAYEQGLEDGRTAPTGSSPASPYQRGTPEHQNYMEGWQDGYYRRSAGW